MRPKVTFEFGSISAGSGFLVWHLKNCILEFDLEKLVSNTYY